jgi:hypothetical protein
MPDVRAADSSDRTTHGAKRPDQVRMAGRHRPAQRRRNDACPRAPVRAEETLGGWGFTVDPRELPGGGAYFRVQHGLMSLRRNAARVQGRPRRSPRRLCAAGVGDVRRRDLHHVGQRVVVKTDAVFDPAHLRREARAGHRSLPRGLRQVETRPDRPGPSVSAIHVPAALIERPFLTTSSLAPDVRRVDRRGITACELAPVDAWQGSPAALSARGRDSAREPTASKA